MDLHIPEVFPRVLCFRPLIGSHGIFAGGAPIMHCLVSDVYFCLSPGAGVEDMCYLENQCLLSHAAWTG